MATRIQTLVNLTAIAVISLLAVELFYTILGVYLRSRYTENIIVSDSSNIRRQIKPPLDHFSVVAARNLFGSREKEQVTPEIRDEEIENLEHTSLQIALLGTVVGSEQDSFAIIEEKAGKKQGLYKLGDSIQSAVVKRILRGKVVLSVQGRDKILTIEEEAASRQASQVATPEPVSQGEHITIDRSEVEKSLTNVHRILSQARVRPHFSAGRPDGLAVTHIKRGSIFEKLGLQHGDIVKGIDGRQIKSPDDVLQMYKKLTLGSQVSVEIERDGQEQTLNYTFR
jgi:general secretion pathway protein C